MREILDFFKDIFMIKEDTKMHIGLSQFKVRQKEIIKSTPIKKKKKDIKLSDLMRGSVN